MSTFKQAVAWWSFFSDQMTAEETVRTIAEAGYSGIDLAGREYWQLIKEHGLTLSAIAGHVSLEDGLNKVENRTRIIDELHTNIDLAVEWNIPNLIVFSGNRNGLDDKTGAEVTAETLRSVAAHAEDAGVTLVLELLNSKVDHPDYQCDKTAWGVDVVKMVDSPRVKLLYDIYHMQIMEGDIIRTIRDNHIHFGHYHTAGNPGRNDLDEEQELYYPPIFRAIAATGFDGFVAHEFRPKGDLTAALQATFDLTNSSL